MDLVHNNAMEINIHQAKTHLSRLLQRVQGGEEITIAKAGAPIARLVPIESSGAKRKLGIDRGLVWIADDFDAPSPEIEALFEGPKDQSSKRRRNAS
jgi:prevent-host-death family protein